MIAASIKMLKRLENLNKVSELYRYLALNLLSCMKLDVENIDSTVHHKDQLFTMLDYARNFGNAANGLKRTTHWVVYYLTNSILGIMYPNMP